MATNRTETIVCYLDARTQEEANKKERAPPKVPTEGTAPSTTVDIPIVTVTPPPTLADREREQAELDEKRKRKGEIKMDNLENVSVEGSL
ncbi:hypothetical protein WJ0W_005486 [Paenibacillus melissococcoides]|uniref:Uncharacterized protein n=1 Tax=Paenibacillus melissococcoides TaxID=2912268 RepID=A0ABM9G8F2_9BACL|nr:hypothetical protein WJ0W_005486 [Paenibacillus melissococcoides]